MRTTEQSFLDLACTAHAESLRHALRAVENQQRAKNHLKPWPRNTNLWISLGKKAALQLLNLKVWSSRYYVSLEFILDVLLHRYRSQRRVRDPNEISFGLPIPMLTGVRARQVVEETVAREFPNGENYKAPRTQFTPVSKLEADDESPDAMIKRYAKIMEARQRSFLKEKPITLRRFRDKNHPGLIQ
jgi:hypothetical protein